LADFISDLNRRTWSSASAAKVYAGEGAPFPAERAILGLVSAGMSGCRLLDIGVGAGRTTGFLLPACKTYVGIDYSPEMVGLARGSHPRADIRCMDARSLDAFGAGEFDMVWFSFNGLDYLSHAGRLQVLSEVHRVLVPGGRFVFSAHNRAVHVPRAHEPANLWLSRSPVRMLRNLGGYVSGIARAAQMRRHEIRTPEYAILNDPEQRYRLLTYYISPSAQREQLRHAGFETEAAFDLGGGPIHGTDECPLSYCVHYLARR
jgi:SAM-dependent methyltransferase